MGLEASDRPQHSECITLGHPFELGHDLRERLERLAAVRTRRQLLRSPVYRSCAETIRSVTFGLEHGRFSSGPRHDSLRVVAWNVQRGQRFEGIVDALTRHDELRRADVFILSEVDVGMARSGNQNVPRELSRALGCDYVFGNSYLCLSAGNARERGAEQPNQLALAGNAILSRHPLVRAENFSLCVSKDKFESSEKRLGHKKALWAEISVGDQPLVIAAVHLDSGASSQERALQMNDVIDRLRERGVDDRALIGGDFNTTTYDANHTWALLANLAKKFSRGGFPHAIEHYLHPDWLYERAVFERLEAAGYETESFNELGVGTLRYVVGDRGSEGRVRDFLPEFAVRYLKKKLEPWAGVVGLKVDWFAGRGLVARGAGTVAEPKFQGEPVSDHDPIWVDL